MNEREAQESVRAIEQMWAFEFGESARELWRKTMMPFDSVTVAGAILKTHESKTERPKLNEFKQEIEAMSAEKEAAMRSHPVGRKTDVALVEPNEWIQVWHWLRFTVGDLRAMPQQDYLGLLGGTSLEEMSLKEYEVVKQQWLDAGSPKVTLAQIVAGLTRVVPTTETRQANDELRNSGTPNGRKA